MKHRKISIGFGFCFFLLACASQASGQVSLLESGLPTAVIVIPDNPYPIAEYAAEELALHIYKVSGVELTILHESELTGTSGPGRLYIGATEQSVAAGIEVSGLASEEAVIRTAGQDLYIVGRDGAGHPLDQYNPNSGTLWGVYEFLEQELGILWVWPGRLGTYAPAAADPLLVGPIDQVVSPQLVRRRVRPGIGRQTMASPLAFSDESFEQYATAQQVFLRRHRMGRTEGHFEPVGNTGSVYGPNRRWVGREGARSYVHAFSGWWRQYGEEHPEWFQLVGDRRGPAPGDTRTSMCVSNPDFQARIIELWKAGREQGGATIPGLPGSGRMHINICENDMWGLCECENCRAWDGEQPVIDEIPAMFRRVYTPFNTSNRYARFAAEIRRLAAEIEPDVKIYMYAYFNYFVAPSLNIELHPNILVGFCPWGSRAGWMPMPDQAEEWMKEQWRGWRASGASLFNRPNWFLAGYALPRSFVRQHARVFNFMYEHGMVGTDYDSLRGQWSSQGTHLYSLVRLHTRPDRPVEEILAEYYSAFGPAAEAVADYFEYWEDYSRRQFTDDLDEREELRHPHYAGFSTAAFAAAEQKLERALELVSSPQSAEYLERVEYLRKGLEHARMCVEFAALHHDHQYYLSQLLRMNGDCPRRNSLEKLIAFRRQMEQEGLLIANFNHCAGVEHGLIRAAPSALSASLDFPLAYQPLSASRPEVEPTPILVRRDTVYLLYAEAGELVELSIRAHSIRDRVLFRILSPSGNRVEGGSLDLRQSSDLQFAASETGIYLIEAFQGSNASSIRTRHPLAVYGLNADGGPRAINLKVPLSELYFWLPAGTGPFEIRVAGERAESFKATLLDGQGEIVDEQDNVSGRFPHLFRIASHDYQAGQVWSIRFERASEGRLGDVFISFSKNLPPVFSFHPDALLVPSGQFD